MNIIRNLFKKNTAPGLDIAKGVGEYLLALPRCGKNIVIVCPEYGENEYACEILMAADDLLPWAEEHAQAVLSLDPEEQAARKALPLWLRGADAENDSASRIPHFMYKILRPYAGGFINDGNAKVFCPGCQSFVEDFKRQKLDEKRVVDWVWWTDLWTCPCGHRLYYEEHELHFYRTHRKSRAE